MIGKVHLLAAVTLLSIGFSCLQGFAQQRKEVADTSAPGAPAAAHPKWPAESAGNPESAKVLVVLIYDDSCYYACKQVRPLIKELVDHYGTSVAYAELNAAPDAHVGSEKRAKDLHLAAYFTDSTNNLPLVGLFNRHHHLLKEIPGAKTKDEYQHAVDSALAVN